MTRRDAVSNERGAHGSVGEAEWEALPYFSRTRQLVDQMPRSFSEDRPDAAGEVTFVADEWTLSRPDGWCDETVYRLDGPTVRGTTVRIVIHVDSGVGDVAVPEYADVRLERQRATTRSRRIVDRKRVRLDEERPALRSRVLETAHETVLLEDQLYVVERGTGYQVTVRLPRTEYARLRPVIEWMFRHFEPRTRGRSGR